MRAMFCPACKAEYRPGFTHCMECDLDLVSELSPQAFDATEASEEAVAEGDYDAQLWCGEDPHFYLALLWAVWQCGIPCFGRPTNPPAFDGDGKPLYQNASLSKFEIRVPEGSSAFARWVLRSSEEIVKERESPSGATEPPKEPRDAPAAVCPLCLAEFSAGDSTCPNCAVPLRLSLDRSQDGAAARILCDLPHPQFTYAIRTALFDEGIPCDNARHFTRGTAVGTFKVPYHNVVVLDSDYERATRVLAQVLQHWEFEPGSGLEPPPRDALKSYWPELAQRRGWSREDLNAGVWTGSNVMEVSSIGLALREHEIPYIVDVSKIGSAKIFIHPEDEAAAREIMREIVGASPYL